MHWERLSEDVYVFTSDRYAQVTDPFGHRWSIGTHVKDVAPEEMEAAAKQSMSGKN